MTEFFERTEGTVKKKRRRSRARFFLYPLLIAFLALLGFYAYRLFFLKGFAAQSRDQIYAQLEEARTALRNLDPAGAREPLATIDEEVRLVQSEAGKYGVLTLSKLWSLVSDKFSGVSAMLQSLAGISDAAIHINDDIAFLKENTAGLMVHKQGPELIARLRQFQEKLATLTSFIGELEQRKETLDEKTLRALANLRAEIYRNNDALDGMLRVLGSPTPQRILVLFQNPSEQRPAGGFIGSYAIVELQNGNSNAIEIRDIYDPDGQLDQKIIPPEELQIITTDWEARDANWFFDYPTSAKKVMTFLANSKIYQEQGITFDGAIAINTSVMQDLMNVVGPISLAEYNMTITPENFLAEIQREVESGEDKKINQPKRILKVLAPLIIEKLTSLDQESKKRLAAAMHQRLGQRDIMLYVNDKGLENYIRSQGIGGDIMSVSQNVIQEYVAVVNTNIAGGKSDAFVAQDINLKSTINSLGEISNTLTVTRTHSGKNEKEWWYRATNKNYIQVYTPLGTKLMSVKGRSKWTKIPVRNYRGYTADEDITAIESTRRYLSSAGVDRQIVNERTVFAGWVNTAAGSSTTYILNYQNPRKINLENVLPYEFVFEKQSGASTTLSISITAPPQYTWKEINKETIEYKTDQPAGRIRIRQTLVPL